MKKRLLSLLLAVCMAASLLVLPAGAAGSTTGFTDITDESTAVAVESLRLLGVLDGFTDGTFRPNNTLTRSQFCKMAICAMNAASQVGQYKAYTIFPDVKPSYWAAAYINLASKGKKIIYGYPNGAFYPNRAVSYGQAVTILMRILGYADADVGAVWPDGYLAAAKTAGLTTGLNLSGSAALTRGQAAKLFSNLMTCKSKDGTSYINTVAASSVEDVVMLSTSATAPDGTTGAMQTSDGKIYKMAGTKQGSSMLNGRKGTLLLDASGRALTFVPSSVGSYKVVTVSVAKAGSLTDTAGAQYTMNADITAYADGKQTTYGEMFSWLTVGTTVTLYFRADGNVEYLFQGGVAAATNTTQVIIVSAQGSTAGLSTLAGGSVNYKLYKNGVAATTADLRQYDVATYDSATNSIRVTDNRLTGYYENCWPNTDAPTKVTVLGHEFTVLSSATGMFAGIGLGSKVTLLLTESNQVAGVLGNGVTAITGDNIGLVTAATGSSAEVRLLNGITISGNPSLPSSTAGSYVGQLVRVQSNQVGRITLINLYGSSALPLDVANRKIGDTPLASNVIIYEKVANSALSVVSLPDILVPSIPAAKISYVGKNWADQVNLLILNDATGNIYTYGRANYQPALSSGSEDDWTHTSATLSVSYGNGESTTSYETAYAAADGAYIGIVASADNSKIVGLVTLTRVGNVANTAWNGQTTVSANGTVYYVPDNVVCYNKTAKTFLSLSSAHAFSSSSNLYVDSHNVVRVIEVA